MNSSMPPSDQANTIHRYRRRFEKHGDSPETLGWLKSRQRFRFDVLASGFSIENRSILDVGCGFGDLNHTLRSLGVPYTYHGVDLVPDFIEVARRKFPEPFIRFTAGEFLKQEFDQEFDVIFSSGVFNHVLEEIDSYVFIEAFMKKAFQMSSVGFAFDFLSDRVDFQQEHNFHARPERILEMAFSLSKNVVLRNDYMPFEFSIFVYKEQSFTKDLLLFDRYLSQYLDQREETP